MVAGADGMVVVSADARAAIPAGWASEVLGGWMTGALRLTAWAGGRSAAPGGTSGVRVDGTGEVSVGLRRKTGRVATSDAAWVSRGIDGVTGDPAATVAWGSALWVAADGTVARWAVAVSRGAADGAAAVRADGRSVVRVDGTSARPGDGCAAVGWMDAAGTDGADGTSAVRVDGPPVASAGLRCKIGGLAPSDVAWVS
jgi:hypothetical protein